MEQPSSSCVPDFGGMNGFWFNHLAAKQQIPPIPSGLNMDNASPTHALAAKGHLVVGESAVPVSS